jgi:hypothetical protein
VTAGALLCEDEAARWLDAMAPVVGLAIPAESRDRVIAQLQLNHRLVAPLLEFELPAAERPSAEPAP